MLLRYIEHESNALNRLIDFLLLIIYLVSLLKKIISWNIFFEASSSLFHKAENITNIQVQIKLAFSS